MIVILNIIQNTYFILFPHNNYSAPIHSKNLQFSKCAACGQLRKNTSCSVWSTGYKRNVYYYEVSNNVR